MELIKTTTIKLDIDERWTLQEAQRILIDILNITPKEDVELRSEVANTSRLLTHFIETRLWEE